ncbi:polymorphic toxin-type HINT domain-containing protein [Streptomyces sp. ISL-66]|uniref:polymorphic toxin-type HINT domain-containing protein n=1 Tax=Streptomyces sp. ISL-66 TaxID=2819186 RepID=UPI0020364121|nr:polymorphic toxin-type HINT domain-containing protein [Streptomyces sp. ISL-66]
MIPGVGEVADLLNCGLYAGEGVVDFFTPTGREGMWQDAALACVSAIPVAGWAAIPAKWARYTEKYGPKTKEVFDQLSNALRRAPSCSIGGNSFPAGTPVLMGDGSTRTIEQIKTGDQVLAADPESGNTGPRRVEATIYTPDDRDFTDITLESATGGGSVTATDHHPFWSQKSRRWADAADLNAGDALRTADGGTVRISGVKHWKTLQPAYNLTVNDLHTYFVLAGRTPVLVHNTSARLLNCGDQIVLGANRGLGGNALRDWLNKKVGDRWQTFNGPEWAPVRNPGDSTSRPLWMEAVEEAALNGSIEISFSLDELLTNDGKQFATAQEAFDYTFNRSKTLPKRWEDIAGVTGSQTAWELGVITRSTMPGNAHTWGGSVKFYWKGKKVELDDPYAAFRD